MSSVRPQIAIHQLKAIIKRRWKLIVLPTIIIAGLTTVIASHLPNKYRSSISILVQQDQTLNPLVSYQMGVSLASQDRLTSFNEILYSRGTAEMLIDSLHLADELEKKESETTMQDLVQIVKRNIQTQLKASDSFDISYYDTDPVRAKKAVTLLSNYFIDTRTRLQNKQNEETVNFFKQKVDEFQQKVKEEQNRQILNTKSNIQQNPVDVTALQGQLQKIGEQISDVNDKIASYQSQLQLLENLPSQVDSDDDIKKLYRLDFSILPNGNSLQKLLDEYSQYTQTYTSKYPKIKELKTHISAAVMGIPELLTAKLNVSRGQLANLKEYRGIVTKDIEEQSVARNQNQLNQSNYQIYQNLYSEMKVKLEQAKVTEELGQKSANQFVVIDAPVVPTRPAKPNRIVLVFGGFMAGLLLGIISAATAELLDTTVRASDDIEFYGKPIIAYISDGKKIK